jgi:hypothetical protein
MSGELRIEEVSNFSPEMAVPMTVKMPDPMTAPMPRAVSESGPRVFLRACAGASESVISLSIDLRAKSCDRKAAPSEVLRQKPDERKTTLSLALSPSSFFQLLLGSAPWAAARTLGSSLLASGALEFLAFFGAFNVLGVCHEFSLLSGNLGGATG